MDNANYLSFSIIILWLFMTLYKSLWKGLLRNIIWWLVLLLTIYIFILAGSRSGLAILGICGLFVIYFSSFKHKLIIATFSFFAILYLNSLSGYNYDYRVTGPLILLNRIQKNTEEDPRFIIWKGIIEASEQTNYTGLGIGQFKSRFHEFFYDENNSLIRRIVLRGYFLSAHSDYFAILIIYGAIGLVAYLIFLFLNIKRLFFKLYHTTNRDEQLYFRYIFTTLLAIILFGVTAESFNSAFFWIVLSMSTKLNISAME